MYFGFTLSTVKVKECSTQERLDQLKASCERARIQYNDSIFKDAKNFARFFVDEREKKIYCGVQSTGTRSWRSVIDEALGLSEGETYNPQLVAHKQKMKDVGVGYLSEYSVADIEQMLKGTDFRKVIVVKHPLSRFLSSFKTRVQNGPLWKLKKLKKVLEKSHDMTVDGYNITLNQFVLLVTQKDPAASDRFWQTYETLCFPCTVRFDGIIKGEVSNLELDDQTAEEEAASKTFSASRPLPPLERLNSREMTQLIAHYNVDMDMFGYAWKSSKATCDQTPSKDSTICC
jgi:hypothetical protein